MIILFCFELVTFLTCCVSAFIVCIYVIPCDFFFIRSVYKDDELCFCVEYCKDQVQQRSNTGLLR